MKKIEKRISKNLVYTTALMVLLSVFIWQSCDDSKLDLTPLGFTEDNYFTNEDEFEKGVFGVYAKLSDKYWFNNNTPKHPMWLLPGDDITSLRNSDFEVFGPISPTNSFITGHWDVLYQLVNRANILFKKLDDETGIYSTPGLKEYHTGELLFLRALANFEIWNFWGARAPLRLEVLGDSDNLEPSGSNNSDQWSTEIFDQVIADLETAAELLPLSWSEENLGRITSNSAYGLLGKALVFRASVTGNQADYSAAISAFDKIQEVELAENYGHNFSVFHQNNIESLFEFQAGQAPTSDNVWLSNDFDITNGSFSAYWGFYGYNTEADHWAEFGTQPLIPTQKLLNSYESGDPRADYTAGPAGSPLPERGRIIKYVQDIVYTDTDVGSLNNPRILRYADILLLKAEALIESGGSTAEAINLINRVRERARNSSDSPSAVPANRSEGETDRDVIFDWIAEERFLELAGEEGHRWFDLRRWHKAGKIDLNQWDFSSVRSIFDLQLPKHLFFPIPQSELDNNTNLTQNEGY